MPTAGALGVGRLWTAALLSLTVAGCGDPARVGPPAGEHPRSSETGDASDAGSANDANDANGATGWVVWESNRSGDWRIWRSPLHGGTPVQLTRDERGRRHCCPHFAPDGERIAYLSLPNGRQDYLDDSAIGSLRSIGIDGLEDVEHVPTARTYFEHRAVTWVDDRRLHFIAEDRSVRTLDLDSGESQRLLEPGPVEGERWLTSPAGDWAATGRGALARVRAGRLEGRIPLPGCQPYFTADSRWGFWTAGAGGPIDRFDLANGEASTLLEKSDSRLPPERGYLYFPMISQDRTLLAFAASDGTHHHFKADYDLFVAELDPDRLEILGRPWSVAAHPAVDRFPDVWRQAMDLPRQVGTVPFVVEPPGLGEGSDWRLVDSLRGETTVDPRLERPGIYALEQDAGGRPVRGVVVAEAPLGEKTSSRAWPTGRDGLLWWGYWPSDGGVAMSTTALAAPGRGLVEESSQLVAAGLRRTNRFSLELLLRPGGTPTSGLAAVLALGRSESRENLLLGERDGRWVLRMRVGPKGWRAFSEADLGEVDHHDWSHLVVTYTPGRLTLYLNSLRTLRSTDLQGHFFHWKAYPLVLGDRQRGGAAWTGDIRALAIYDRLLSPVEVAANFALLEPQSR